MTFAQRLADVEARMAAACARAGRRREDVLLVAVSKTQPDEAVREAYAAGVRDFGENYAQALRDRAERLDLPGARWHMVGALQKNKAKYVARHAVAFHALDDAELARELGRRAARVIDTFIEVNVGGEAQKAGVPPGAVEALLRACQGVANLRLVGLMCIPPPEDDPRPHFRQLRALAEKLSLPQLSMGMTADYEAAIEEGATVVRVGTALFGQRRA